MLSLPAIPEIRNKPLLSARNYDSEKKYRRDLLVFASYNAAGLLSKLSLPMPESPERKARRALEEARAVENKIHSRVQYLVNQEKKILNKLNQTRDNALKILSVKEQKDYEANRIK